MLARRLRRRPTIKATLGQCLVFAGWPGRILDINPLTAGVAYIRVFIFYYHIKYHLLNMLKIKYDINQHHLKTVDLHFVKSEKLSLT